MAKSKLDRTLRKKLNLGDWGGYIDLQNLMLLSFDNLVTFTRKAQQNADIEEKDLESLGRYMTSFRFTNKPMNQMKEIHQNIRFNSEKILDLLQSANDQDLGLIPLIKKEIADVTSLLGSNPGSPVSSEATLRQHVINYNQLKERKYQLLRSLLARNDTLSKSAVRQHTATVLEEVQAFVNLFEDFHVLLVERKAGDEPILMKLLEMFIVIEGYRDNLRVEFQNEFDRNAHIPSRLQKDKVRKVIENYFHFYSHPIIDRIMEVRKIMSAYQNTFINIPDAEKEKVLKLYNEFKGHLFDSTDYKDKFDEISTSASVGELRKELDKFVVELERKVAEKYQSSGYTHDGFYNLIIIDNSRGHSFWANLIPTASTSNSLRLREVYEKLNGSTKDKDKEGLLKSIILVIKDNYLKDDTGFATFEKMQDSITFIGKIGIDKLKIEFYDKVKQMGKLIGQYYSNYQSMGDTDDDGYKHLQHVYNKFQDKSLIIANSRGKKIHGYHTLGDIETHLINTSNPDKQIIRDVNDILQVIIDADLKPVINLNMPRASSQGNPFGGSGGSGGGGGSSRLRDEDIRRFETEFINNLKVFGAFIKVAQTGSLDSNIQARGQQYTTVKNAANYFIGLNSNDNKRNNMFKEIVRRGFQNRDVSLTEVSTLFSNISTLISLTSDSSNVPRDIASSIITILNTFARFGVINDVNSFVSSS